jgi:hypothetical protein
MITLSPLAKNASQYSFAIISDPQLGDNKDYYGSWAKNPNINYRMYYQTIQKINALQPAFAVINGDFVNRYYIPAQYRNFVRMTKLLQVPVVLVHGNHNGIAPFTQFFDAQQELSGQRSLYYSFDVGKWHYIVLPSIPRNYDPEAMLNWLANDLKANQTKPTTVFTHYHYLPQGLTQLEYYTQQPRTLRHQILNTALAYGNVKYWYIGHVHNGIKTSVKTAWEYRGTKFITVPTTVIARNFGEEYPLFKKGLTKGGYFMTIDVNGETATLVGQRADQPDTFTYPSNFRPFSPQFEPRWLEGVPNFTPQPFTNGSFEQGLQGWQKVWRYIADRKPGFVSQSSRAVSTAGNRSLLLSVREKGRHWANDELVEVYQLVSVPQNTFPLLRLKYYIDQSGAIGGGYIRLHGYRQAEHQFTMLFYVGSDSLRGTEQNTSAIFDQTASGEAGNPGEFGQLVNQKKVMFWKLNQQEDQWHHLKVDIRKLYQRASGLIGQPQMFDVDKLFLSLGVWNGKVPDSMTKLFFDQVSLTWRKTPSVSANDGNTLPVRNHIYRGRFVSKDKAASGRNAYHALESSLFSAKSGTDRKHETMPLDLDPLTGSNGVNVNLSGDRLSLGSNEGSVPDLDSPNFFDQRFNVVQSRNPIKLASTRTTDLLAKAFELGSSTIRELIPSGGKSSFDGAIASSQGFAPSPLGSQFQPSYNLSA